MLPGKGDGSFASAVSRPIGGELTALAVTDYNGDKNPDVVAGIGGSGVTFLVGDGKGSFRARQDVATVGAFPNSVVAGDLDGDGFPDITAAGGNVATIRSRGDGTFEPAALQQGDGVRAAIADLDGDHLNDIVLAANQNVTVLRNKSGPPLPAPTVAKTANVERVKGAVLVKRPGSRGFVRLGNPKHIPIGSELDTTRGTVSLTTAAGRGGKTQSGSFHGGLFKLGQKRGKRPFTELTPPRQARPGRPRTAGTSARRRPAAPAAPRRERRGERRRRARRERRRELRAAGRGATAGSPSGRLRRG